MEWYINVAYLYLHSMWVRKLITQECEENRSAINGQCNVHKHLEVL
jgi:hypothetical protein